MSQDNANRERAEVIREADRRDEVLATAHGETAAGDTRKDLVILPNWTLDKYRHERVGMMDFKRFDFMAVDSKKFIIYDRNCFSRDTALGAWKRRLAVLSRWCAGILVDTRLADM